MLYTIAVVLVVLWVLGLVSSHTLSSFVHLLLVIAIVVIVINIIRSRKLL
ncbi:MAG: lmo0937 family membrane protein [Candidatus Brocadiales bacterium]|nr:lmo0937 family membrane protein [Candidatus Brocadiales bacterium]